MRAIVFSEKEKTRSFSFLDITLINSPEVIGVVGGVIITLIRPLP